MSDAGDDFGNVIFTEGKDILKKTASNWHGKHQALHQMRQAEAKTATQADLDTTGFDEAAAEQGYIGEFKLKDAGDPAVRDQLVNQINLQGIDAEAFGSSAIIFKGDDELKINESIYQLETQMELMETDVLGEAEEKGVPFNELYSPEERVAAMEASMGEPLEEDALDRLGREAKEATEELNATMPLGRSTPQIELPPAAR